MKRRLRRIVIELVRFIVLVALTSVAASLMGLLITDSSFWGFFENLHLDRDGAPIAGQFWEATKGSLPILVIAILLLVGGAMLVGSVLEHPDLGWVKVLLLSISALPSFLFPLLPSLFWPSRPFGGMPQGGIWVPAICLALGDCNLSTVSAHFRESLRRQRAMPHVQTLETLGLSVWRFTWPKACISLLSALAGRIPHLVGGIIALELLFNIQGIGVSAYQAVTDSPADLHWLFWIGVFCVVLRSAFRWVQLLFEAGIQPETVRSDDEEEEFAEESEGFGSVDAIPQPLEPRARAGLGAAGVNVQTPSRVQISSHKELDVPEQPADIVDHLGTTLPQVMFRNAVYYWRLKSSHKYSVCLAIGLMVLLLMLVIAACVYGESPPGKSFLDPDSDHWFGTDLAGMDVLSSIVVGMQQMVLPIAFALFAATLMAPFALLSLYAWVRTDWLRACVRFTDECCLLTAEFVESLPKLLVLLAGFSLMAGSEIDVNWLGVSFSVHTMVLRLFFLIGFLHAPQVYRSLREELSLINHSVYVEASWMARMRWHQLFLRTVLRNHCVPVLLIQFAAIIAGVLHYDAVLGLIGVRGRGVIFTLGSQLGMGMDAYMNYAPMAWFNRWILVVPLLFVWMGIVVFWLFAESLKTTVGGYVYRLR